MPEVLMKNTTCVWRNIYIINTSPNPRAIFHLYFSNPVTSYTYYKAWQNYCILIGGKANNLINCTLHKLSKMTVQPFFQHFHFFIRNFRSLKFRWKIGGNAVSFQNLSSKIMVRFKRQMCVFYHKLALVARPIFTNFSNTASHVHPYKVRCK